MADTGTKQVENLFTLIYLELMLTLLPFWHFNQVPIIVLPSDF